MRTKLALLGIAQCFALIMGVSLIASVAPSYASEQLWIRIAISAGGVTVLLLGLWARDEIREMTRDDE